MSATAVVLLACAATASAQSWLYATLQPYGSIANPSFALVEAPLTPTGPGGIQRVISIPGWLSSGPEVSYDGRHVVWIASIPGPDAGYRIMLLDRRTGHTGLLPIEVPTGRLIADPTALRFLVVGEWNATTLAVVEPTGVRTVSVPAIWNAGPLSSDGRELFVVRQTVSGSSVIYRIVVLDPLTGLEIRRLPEFPPYMTISSMVLSRDGQRLYAATSSPISVKLLDSESGAELASRAFPSGPFGYSGVQVQAMDEMRNRLFVGASFLSGSVGEGSLVVLDGSTLATLGAGEGLSNVIFDHTQAVGVNVSTGAYYHGCAALGSTIRVETWGAPSQPMSLVDTGLGDACVSLALATAPEAPASASHEVSVRRVTVSWSAVQGASDYVVDVALASGGPALGQVRTGAMTQLVVDNVPTGTYYVRVRAINDVGIGAASSELAVVVAP